MTAVELLITAAVVTVALVAVASAVPTAIQAVHQGGQVSTAVFLASARLEQVRRASWTASPARDALGLSPAGSEPPLHAGEVTFPDEPEGSGDHPEYARRVRIADCGAAGGCGGVASADLRQVTVTVLHRPGSAASGAAAPAVALTTLVARR